MRKETGVHISSSTKKMIEELRKDLIFLENYVVDIFNTQKKIKAEIEKIKIKTKQNLKEEQLIKELWILRYSLLHSWFFNLKPPKNQDELTVNISLINRAFQDIRGTSDYLPWLTKGFTEYAGTSQLDFSNLEKFESHVMEKVSEKIPLIAFECTEGRLGGELHDFIIELIMTTITQDKKTFVTGISGATTEEENKNIKKIIREMSEDRKKLAEDFIDSFGENE